MNILGLDFGGVIKVHGEDRLVDDVADTLNVIERFFSDLYVISRVDNREDAQKVRIFLANHYTELGIQLDHVFFCLERDEKARLANALAITHFVDDRTEVLHYMDGRRHHTVKYRYALNPTQQQLSDWPLNGAVRVNNWKEIRNDVLCQIYRGLANSPDGW